MSDFLKEFSQENYKRRQKDQSDGQEERNPNPSDTHMGPIPANFMGSQRVTARVMETGIPDNARDEVFEKDPNSDKKKRKKILLLIGGILIGCFLIGMLYYFSSTVKVPNFVGGYYDKANVWGIQNKVHIEAEEVFNLEFYNGIVISQSISAQQKIFKGNSLNIVVSKGADPDEHIKIPDFATMSVHEIEQWRQELKIDNVTINKEFDDTVPVNTFIKKEYRDPTVTDETFKRKDRLTITVSKGPETFEKDIDVPDFVGKPESEATEWANSKGIKIKIESAYSNTVAETLIISQSISPKTKIAKNEELTLSVSKGKAIYAPSFNGLSKEEAEIKAAAENVMINIMDQYNASVGYGNLISQSIKPGSLLREEQNMIILYYSAGLPFIPELTGQTENDAIQLFATMNSQKANLSYKFKYTSDGQTPKGTVIFNTNANSRVAIGSVITITISTGGKAIIGDYVNHQLESEYIQMEIQKLEGQGLKIIYEYIVSTKPGGTIVRQSIKAGEQINTADHYLKIEISN